MDALFLSGTDQRRIPFANPLPAPADPRATSSSSGLTLPGRDAAVCPGAKLSCRGARRGWRQAGSTRGSRSRDVADRILPCGSPARSERGPEGLRTAPSPGAPVAAQRQPGDRQLALRRSSGWSRSSPGCSWGSLGAPLPATLVPEVSSAAANVVARFSDLASFSWACPGIEGLRPTVAHLPRQGRPTRGIAFTLDAMVASSKSTCCSFLHCMVQRKGQV